MQSFMLRAIRNLSLKAAWAPICVLIFHAIIVRTPLRRPLDFLIHSLGGASIAFFVFHMLNCFETLFGATTRFGRYVFSFALACTVGLFWEFGELASDVYLHTHIQQSLHETMSDLIADATGAIASLLLVCLVRQFSTRSIRPATPTK